MLFGISRRGGTKRRSDDRLTLCQSLTLLFTNKAFIIVELVYLCGLTAVILIQTNLLLYAKYIVDSEDSITFMILMVQGVALLALPGWLWFSKKIRKEANVLRRWYYRGHCGALSVFSSTVKTICGQHI